MSAMSPEQVQVVVMVIVTCLVALLMVQSGVGKHMLSWKRRPYCPSCGRNANDCACRQRSE